MNGQNYQMLKELHETQKGPMPDTEFKSIALSFANEMNDRFSPSECNEIIMLIRQRWSEIRQLEIEKAEKRIAYLIESLSNL